MNTNRKVVGVENKIRRLVIQEYELNDEANLIRQRHQTGEEAGNAAVNGFIQDN